MVKDSSITIYWKLLSATGQPVAFVLRLEIQIALRIRGVIDE